jgi:uncharacterized LabA/DUF88 family protein
MGFVIVIDGPNFINDLEACGKDVNYILGTLSLPAFQMAIQERLRANGLLSHPFIHTYFVCSEKKRIGESIRGSDRDRLIEKLRNQRGVTVDEIRQSHGKGKEQQVDMSVFIRMLEVGPLAIPMYDPWRHIVLVSSDSDYVPAIRMLSRMGTHTIVVGFRNLKEKEYPIELINESFLFLEMSEILTEMEKAPRG